MLAESGLRTVIPARSASEWIPLPQSLLAKSTRLRFGLIFTAQVVRIGPFNFLENAIATWECHGSPVFGRT